LGTKILNADQINALYGWRAGTWVMCYQLTRDEYGGTIFHRMCDKLGSIFVVIKTTKGNIFGGYSGLGFSSTGFFMLDETAYAYSLIRPGSTTPEQYPCSDASRGIFDYVLLTSHLPPFLNAVFENRPFATR